MATKKEIKKQRGQDRKKKIKTFKATRKEVRISKEIENNKEYKTKDVINRNC